MLIFAVKSSFLPNLVNFMTGYKYCFIVFLFLFNFSSPISAFDIKDEEINQDGINKGSSDKCIVNQQINE